MTVYNVQPPPFTAECLLAAAERIFVRSGARGLTMRRLAREVGLTPMAVYHHFRDKDALIDAIAMAGYARLDAAMAPARDPERPPVDRVRLLLLAYAAFAEAEPEIFVLMVTQRNRGRVRYPEYFTDGRSPTFDALRGAVAEAMRMGRFRAGDSTEAALTLWAGVHGLVVLRTTDYLARGKPFRELVTRCIDRVIAGLAVPS